MYSSWAHTLKGKKSQRGLGKWKQMKKEPNEGETWKWFQERGRSPSSLSAARSPPGRLFMASGARGKQFKRCLCVHTRRRGISRDYKSAL